MFKALFGSGTVMASGLSLLMVMTATDVTMLMTAFTSLVSCVLAGVAAIYSARAKASSEDNKEKLKGVKETIALVEVNTNSMSEHLVKTTRLEALETGRKEGKEEAKLVSEAVAEAVAIAEAKRPADVAQAVKVVNEPTDKVPVVNS